MQDLLFQINQLKGSIILDKKSSFYICHRENFILKAYAYA
ncbi:hypothetical protein QE390_005007 [Siphonobacter sp. SORGH_AS 1065]|nr:hypothetical protein [Siphonobacter sp. SORGH_AS_1065]